MARTLWPIPTALTGLSGPGPHTGPSILFGPRATGALFFSSLSMWLGVPLSIEGRQVISGLRLLVQIEPSGRAFSCDSKGVCPGLILSCSIDCYQDLWPMPVQFRASGDRGPIFFFFYKWEYWDMLPLDRTTDGNSGAPISSK